MGMYPARVVKARQRHRPRPRVSAVQPPNCRSRLAAARSCLSCSHLRLTSSGMRAATASRFHGLIPARPELKWSAARATEHAGLRRHRVTRTENQSLSAHSVPP